jgi:hypothetical protein
MPCASRRTTSRIGARIPIELCVGRQPIRNVAGREAHRVGPERGQRADQRLGVREEQLVEDQRGGCAVQEEVVPLDRGTDEAGCHDRLERSRLPPALPIEVR